MADNSSRRAIEFLVYGALPPHSTNVLWMDSSNPSMPVLKIWWNGTWVQCHTDDNKEIALLVAAIEQLSNANEKLSDQILGKLEEIKGLIGYTIEEISTV